VNHIQSSIPTWATSQANSAISASALQTIFNIQAGLIINNRGSSLSLEFIALRNCSPLTVGNPHSIAPVAEMFFDNGHPDKIGTDIWQLLPFSRGNVSIVVRSLLTHALSLTRLANKKCSSLVASPG
jgi:choline dehydrogenase